MNELQYSKVLNPLAKKGVIKLFSFQPKRNDRTTEKLTIAFFKSTLSTHATHKSYSTNNLNVLSIKWLCIYGTIFFLKSSKSPQPLARYFSSWFSLLGVWSLICLKGFVHLSACYELFSSYMLCTCHVWPPPKEGKKYPAALLS